MRSSSPTARATNAMESFSNASECIGKCVKDMSLFAITRGQWSMIDAVLHVLNEVGPSKVSLWTWTVAEYEVQVLARLRMDKKLLDGRLIIDAGARNKNSGIIAEWQNAFGPQAVRYVINHSKIATVESANGLKFLLRGSMNLNFNPRFEQFDISEGGPAFELVKEIEDSLPFLPNNCVGSEPYKATKLDSAFTVEQLTLFSNPKTWKPNRSRSAK
jgi:hypothetical protein